MPKIISDKNERQIAQLVRNWPTDHSLNWNSICLGAQEILGWGAPPTRQALNKKLLIKSAYKAKKGQLKSVETKLDGMSKPRSTLDAMKKISRLQAENDALKAQPSTMAELANRLIYNASIAGLSRERLMTPLPTVHEPKKKLKPRK
ncbi:hypothetical protein [Stutzerimonas stutzeri]|uniref:hypothetical protein n=1 Tax=Stutzerimonas stutzeri TaxID=316 RepID=UPI0009B7A467|nr:hypothetical protein [Stutzerimonas stutzeri]